MLPFIRDKWGLGVESTQPLGGAGGFSGAEFWRVRALDERQYCLRRWPVEHPGRDLLQWIHSVLSHVSRQGFTKCPVPRATQAGETIVEHGGHLWQLEPWLAGEADYHVASSDQKLRAAVQAVAQFHQASASFDCSLSAAPAATTRAKRIHQLLGQLPRIVSSLRQNEWPTWQATATQIVEHFHRLHRPIELELQRATTMPVPLLPCIRDVWHDHVLFVNDQVSGIVDFGAMRHESAAGDIARLVGSLVQDDRSGWQRAISHYEEVRPLTDNERALINVYDRSSVLCSGMNWLSWLIVEGRQFDNHAVILSRLEQNLARLIRCSN